MKITIAILSSLISFFCIAQNTQWANKVKAYSSQYEDKNFPQQYYASQILGKPSRFPAYGMTANAWRPSQEDNTTAEWIYVEYDKPIYVQQVLICENENAGCISKIIFIDEKEKENIIYETSSKTENKTGGNWSYFFMNKTNYAVKSVKVYLQTDWVKGWNAIDAIGISDSKDSIKLRMNLIKGANIKIEREDLGEGINSTSSELAPVIASDNKTIYFTRQSHPDNIAPIDNQDIWYSKLGDDGKFLPAVNLGEPINNSENSSALSISADGQQLLVSNIYNEDGSMSKGVSFSYKEGDKWGMPKKITIDNFYNDNQYGEYNLSGSGKVMVMTIQRKDGYGSKDIHVSFLKNDGTWTEPKNTGKVLNTADSESSPFIGADEKTLYFSSNGHPGYGKNDVFVTHRLDDTWLNWSEPENLGPYLNTPAWDAYYIFTSNGEYVYYVSTVEGKSQDIFRKKVPEGAKTSPVVIVKGNVYDLKTHLPLASKIAYQYLKTNVNAGYALSNNKTGEYSIVLPSGSEYSFLAEADNYYSISENIDLSKITSYTEIKRDLYLAPIETGLAIRLNNLFFDFDKSDLKPESVPELERLINLLNKYSEMKIEIAGHTDNIGSDEYNNPLSRRRAESVKNYLISKGIAKSRLTSQGYGKTKPVAKGNDDESRRLNRRVEFIIVSMK